MNLTIQMKKKIKYLCAIKVPNTEKNNNTASSCLVVYVLYSIDFPDYIKYFPEYIELRRRQSEGQLSIRRKMEINEVDLLRRILFSNEDGVWL